MTGSLCALFAASLLSNDGCALVIQGQPVPSRYLDAVRLYREGSGDEALRRMASLEGTERAEVVQRVKDIRHGAHRGTLPDAAPGDVCLAAASVMELELGMAFTELFQWDAADDHFEAGWTMSLLLSSIEHETRFQRDWLLAAGLFHHQRVFVGASPQAAFLRAERYLHEATRRYPEDVEVLLANAALLEWSGSLAAGDRDHLVRAESLYSEASRLKPDEPEALLRHGRALQTLGRGNEAEAAFRRVLALPSRADLVYRSWMALGSLAESGGRLEDALEDYAAAARTKPGWQVAHLASSVVLHRKGDHASALDVLERALTVSPPEESNDEWWQYELGLVRLLDPLVERMRAEARK